jgi:CheY-like chemotaxis protein
MPRHHTFILRMWETRSAPPDPPSRWRFSLRDVHTGEERKFPDVKSLSAFLEARIEAEGGVAPSAPEAERLPVQRIDRDGDPTEGRPDRGTDRTSVLLVENDDALRQQLRRWLEATIPDVVISAGKSGDSAVSAVQSAPPDLILVDVTGMGATSLDILRHLRSHAPAARIVALGTEENQAYEKELRKAGAGVYLQMWKIHEQLAPAMRDPSVTHGEGVRDKTVVCIEDEPDMISLIKLALDRQRVRLIGALGGREGLEKVRQVKPDLVLLDLMMPDINGAEVLEQMKADERLRDIPIIVITVLDRRYTAQQGLDLQRVNGFIRKPFMPQELVETVNSALRPVA